MVRVRNPVRRNGGGRATTTALQLGAGEQLGQLGLVSGRQQGQPVEHAADRGPSRRQRVSLA
jgi:hypothetical protein